MLLKKIIFSNNTKDALSIIVLKMITMKKYIRKIYSTIGEERVMIWCQYSLKFKLRIL